jgi:hypothetical protein
MPHLLLKPLNPHMLLSLSIVDLEPVLRRADKERRCKGQGSPIRTGRLSKGKGTLRVNGISTGMRRMGKSDG